MKHTTTYESILRSFDEALAQVHTRPELKELQQRYMGKNGIIDELNAAFKAVSLEEKRALGPALVALKKHIHDSCDRRVQQFDHEELLAKQRQTHIDVTAGKGLVERGHYHPYSHAIRDVIDIFTSMGFALAEGPEVETDWNNFGALNMPDDHPARDMHDTFWLTDPGYVLRTHTSTMQIRTAYNQEPPIAIFAPGRVYRREATDASHDFMFYQCEGLLIDTNVSMSNLLYTMQTFLQAFFRTKDIGIRVRPSYFPFVEPGVEIDMTCPFCTDGCSVCKQTKLIEICGGGMVHPHVLRAMNIDPERYSGFAFGFGLTRLVMLKYGIRDIRMLHTYTPSLSDAW